MKKKLLFLLIIVGAIICLCSCKEKYTVTFDPNGAEMSTQQITVVEKEFYALPIPKRVGYGFLGWYNGDEKIENTGKWNKTENLHLVAKWEFLEFTVGLDNDGNGDYENQIKYNASSETFTIDPPKKEGKFFSHWTDQNGIIYEGTLEIPKGSEGDLYLSASWWDFTYKDVIYEYDGSALYVVGYKGNYKQNIEIPSKIFGTDVVGIKDGVFNGAQEKTVNSTSVFRIYIPSTIKSIGENAFNDCKNVKVVLTFDLEEYDYLEEAKKWLDEVNISSIGNDHLKDVILRRRPSIGATIYVQ